MKQFNKRIGLVVANNRFGGQEKRYFKIAYKLYQEGYDVKLYVHKNLVNQNNLEIDELLKDNGFLNRITFISVPRLLRKLYKEVLKKNLFLHKLCNQINIDKTDIIITNKDLKSLAVFKASLVKIVKDFTSPDDIDLFFKTKDYKYIKNVHHYFFISQSVYNRFANQLNQNEMKIKIPNYSIFHLPFYEPPKYEKLDWSEKEKSIVFAHRLIERKNPKLFAEAIKLMIKDQAFDKWRIYFLGRGPLFDELNAILKKEIQSGRVTLKYTSKLNNYLKKSSIFVSLIEPDNFPSQSILEAMYFGNALVILNSGDSHSFISDNGLLVEKSSRDIKEKMSLLIKSNLVESAKNSKQLIESKFNSQNYTEFYISELQKRFS